MVRVSDGGLLGVRVVDDLDTAHILQLLDDCQQPFEDSMLYSAGADAKFVDKSTRLSRYRAIVQQPLFDASALLLQQISMADDKYDYTLVRSDVTQIVYSEGGFFKRHADFLSLATNFVEEQTLLVCITPPALARESQGGATTIHANGKSVDFDATTTPGRALLFRKDLEHEGQVVRAGEKHILSLNVWAHRKKSTQVLLISFPAESESRAAGGSTGSATLLAAANAKAYAMRADDAAGMLATKIEWANRAADDAGTPRPPVIAYACRDATYAEFGTIFRILSRMHVTASELVERQATLDYFLPALRLEDVLIDLATAPPSETLPVAAVLEPGRRVIVRVPPEDRPTLKDVEGVVCGACAEDETTGACYPVLPDGDAKEAVLLPHFSLEPMFDDLAAATKKAAEAAASSASDHEAGETDAEVICCETEERTQVLVELARALDLPYVRFKMVFVEGVLLSRQDADFQMAKVPVTLACCTLGDYDNIFAYRRLAPTRPDVAHIQPMSMSELDYEANLFDWNYGLVDENQLAPGSLLLSHHMPFRNPHDYDRENMLPPSVGLGLRVALATEQADAEMNRLLFERESPDIHNIPVVYLPGMPPSYAPLKKPVWVVSITQPAGYDQHSSTLSPTDDFEPMDEAVQARLEAQYATVSNEAPSWSREKFRLVLPQAERASWQVCLRGSFTPYEPEVQQSLEAEWGAYGDTFSWSCAVEVQGVKYVVRRADGGGLIQMRADDHTKTRAVKRVGGPIVITWYYRSADARGAAVVDGYQNGPDDELHFVKRASHPDEIPTPSAASSGEAAPESAAPGEAPTEAPVVPAALHEAKRPRISEATPTDDGPAGGYDEGDEAPESFFHRDGLGKTCFTRDEADLTALHVGNMHLDDRVKKCLQRKKFVLPQQSRNMGDGFCNESVYGTLNLLNVTGVVRLDMGLEKAEADRDLVSTMFDIKQRAADQVAESKSINETFDAWPAPEVRNDTIHMAFAQGDQLAAMLPDGEVVHGNVYWNLREESQWDAHSARIAALLGMQVGGDFP